MQRLPKTIQRLESVVQVHPKPRTRHPSLSTRSKALESLSNPPSPRPLLFSSTSPTPSLHRSASIFPSFLSILELPRIRLFLLAIIEMPYLHLRRQTTRPDPFVRTLPKLSAHEALGS